MAQHRRGLRILLVTAAVLAATGAAVTGVAAVRDRMHTQSAQATSSRFIPAGHRQQAPDITGRLLDGTRFSTGRWAGQVVVVNFWGSWCAPCRAEAHHLEATYQQTEASGVRFLGVDVRDTVQAATAFEARFGITYPSIFDPDGRIALRLRKAPPNAVPTTIVLDRTHRYAAIFPKAITARQLLPVVTGLAQEPTQKPTPPPA